MKKKTTTKTGTGRKCDWCGQGYVHCHKSEIWERRSGKWVKSVHHVCLRCLPPPKAARLLRLPLHKAAGMMRLRVVGRS